MEKSWQLWSCCCSVCHKCCFCWYGCCVHAVTVIQWRGGSESGVCHRTPQAVRRLLLDHHSSSCLTFCLCFLSLSAPSLLSVAALWRPTGKSLTRAAIAVAPFNFRLGLARSFGCVSVSSSTYYCMYHIVLPVRIAPCCACSLSAVCCCCCRDVRLAHKTRVQSFSFFSLSLQPCARIYVHPHLCTHVYACILHTLHVLLALLSFFCIFCMHCIAQLIQTGLGRRRGHHEFGRNGRLAHYVGFRLRRPRGRRGHSPARRLGL